MTMSTATKTTKAIEYQIVVPEAIHGTSECWATRMHCEYRRINALVQRILFGSKWQDIKTRPEIGVYYAEDDFGTLTFAGTIYPPITWQRFKAAFIEAVEEVLFPIDVRTIQFKRSSK